MGISCKPWGKLKSGFDKLTYQMKKEEEAMKKFSARKKEKKKDEKAD